MYSRMQQAVLIKCSRQSKSSLVAFSAEVFHEVNTYFFNVGAQSLEYLRLVELQIWFSEWGSLQEPGDKVNCSLLAPFTQLPVNRREHATLLHTLELLAVNYKEIPMLRERLIEDVTKHRQGLAQISAGMMCNKAHVRIKCWQSSQIWVLNVWAVISHICSHHCFSVICEDNNISRTFWRLYWGAELRLRLRLSHWAL